MEPRPHRLGPFDRRRRGASPAARAPPPMPTSASSAPTDRGWPSSTTTACCVSGTCPPARNAWWSADIALFAFTPDSRRLIAASRTEGHLQLFDLASGREAAPSTDRRLAGRPRRPPQRAAVPRLRPTDAGGSRSAAWTTARWLDGWTFRRWGSPPHGPPTGRASSPTHSDFSVRVWDWPSMGAPRLVLRLPSSRAGLPRDGSFGTLARDRRVGQPGLRRRSARRSSAPEPSRPRRSMRPSTARLSPDQRSRLETGRASAGVRARGDSHPRERQGPAGGGLQRRRGAGSPREGPTASGSWTGRRARCST